MNPLEGFKIFGTIPEGTSDIIFQLDKGAMKELRKMQIQKQRMSTSGIISCVFLGALGLGIGIIIAKYAIDEHNGKIEY